MNKISLGVAVATLSASMAMAQDYPLTIENCGHTVTFDVAPESVVSIGQATSEALYLLGLR